MIKIFHSSQSGAPTCTGQVSSFINILRACLINGYNTKTVSTLTVSSNVATVVTSSDHNYNLHEVIVISGANESVFNDSFRITEITNSTTFKFSVTTVLTEATGTISCKISPLGWVEEFTGTNIAVFRATEGSRIFAQMVDSSTLYTTFQSYENMTGPSTGTNLVGTAYIRKSDVASSATRPWTLIGNKKCFYFFNAFYSGYPTTYASYSCGDFISYKSGDAYNYQAMAHNTTTAPSDPYTYSNFYVLSFSNLTGNFIGRRTHGSFIASQTFAKISAYTGEIGVTSSYGFYVPFPGLNYGVTLFPIFILDSQTIRGKLSGLFCSLEYVSGKLDHLSIITDNNLKKYIVLRIGATSNGVTNAFLSLDASDWA